MFNRKIFAARLRQLRNQENISTQKLAEAIGLKSKGGITQFEKSIISPSVDTLIALADFFNVSVDFLAGRSNDPAIHQPVPKPTFAYASESKEIYNPNNVLDYVIEKKYDIEYLCKLLELNLIVLTNRERKSLTPEQKEGFLSYLRTGDHPELYDPNVLDEKDPKAAHQTRGLKHEGLKPELLTLMNITTRLNKILIKYLDSTQIISSKDDINGGLLK